MLRYKNYRLIKPNAKQSKRILDLINQNNGSIFQEIDFNKLVEYQFNTDLYYLVDNETRINNFTPVHIVKDKFKRKKYNLKPLYDIPYAGFLKENDIDFNQLKIGLFDSLVYQGLPSFQPTKDLNDISRFGETSFIDLSLAEDMIFNNVIHSKRRNMIRKAIKSDIRVEKYGSSQGMDIFWPILEKLHNALGFSHLTKNYYKKILDVYGPKKQAMVLVAFKNEQAISGIITLGNKHSFIYYKGASLRDIKNEGQGELLQWEAIKTVKDLGVQYYDLGNLDKKNLPSLYRFKTGISKNIVKYPIVYKSAIGFKILSKIENLSK